MVQEIRKITQAQPAQGDMPALTPAPKDGKLKGSLFIKNQGFIPTETNKNVPDDTIGDGTEPLPKYENLRKNHDWHGKPLQELDGHPEELVDSKSKVRQGVRIQDSPKVSEEKVKEFIEKAKVLGYDISAEDVFSKTTGKLSPLFKVDADGNVSFADMDNYKHNKGFVFATIDGSWAVDTDKLYELDNLKKQFPGLEADTGKDYGKF